MRARRALPTVQESSRVELRSLPSSINALRTLLRSLKNIYYVYPVVAPCGSPACGSLRSRLGKAQHCFATPLLYHGQRGRGTPGLEVGAGLMDFGASIRDKLAAENTLAHRITLRQRQESGKRRVLYPGYMPQRVATWKPQGIKPVYASCMYMFAATLGRAIAATSTGPTLDP